MIENYEIVKVQVRPVYSFVEDDSKEHWWLDSQNCYYYLLCEELDSNTDKRYDGKKYWIIEPHLPKGFVVTEGNIEEAALQFKWLVTFTSEEEDEGKEWDFKNHKPYEL